MSLSAVSARRPIGTAMVYIAVVILGVVAAQRLAVDLMPEVDAPRISITTRYEGVAPEEMETLITRPVEQVLSTIEGIEKIESVSAEGISRVQLRFAWGKDLDVAVNDVREQLDRLRTRLPEEADTPSIWKFNLSDLPVARLGLSGGGDVRRLRYLAEDELSRRLERVAGVAAVSVRGGREREIQVRLDPQRLAALGVSAPQVSAALARENRNVSAGDMQATGREVLIRSVGEFRGPSEIADTVVSVRDGRPIIVRDLGEVADTFKELDSELWIDGETGIRMRVSKRSGANTVEVAAALRREVEAINRDYAGRLKLSLLWDGSDYIEKSVTNVRTGALYGALLAVVVLLIFLRDLRATAIIGASIPISVLATMVLMHLYGFTLNIISLGGIALGVGMLVDSAIVVLESIHRKRQERHGKLEAAIQGSREVALAIVAGTLTTVAVFAPVVFMGGFAGVFFREMAVVVCFALFCSLVVALSLIPAGAARLLHEGARPALVGGGRRRGFVAATDRWLAGVDAGYRRLLGRSLHRPALVVLASVLVLAASLLIAPFLQFELMPQTDEGELDVDVELPVGTPVETTMEVMRDMEARVRQALRPGELQHLITVAGPEAWWRPSGSHEGSMEVILVPVSRRERSAGEVAGAIRKALSGVPGATLQVREASSNILLRMLRGDGDRLAVEIRGHDLATAEDLARRVTALLGEVPGVADAKPDREEGKMERTLHVDRTRLADLGLTGAEVSDTVEHYVLGKVATRLREGGDEFDIRVLLRKEHRDFLEQLPRLPLITRDGRVIPLAGVASIEARRGPASIAREDQQRILKVNAGLADDAVLGDVVEAMGARLARLEVPDGFTVSIGGEFLEQQKIFADLAMGIALALFLVYTVMAIQFESVRHPLIIMTAVPFSLIGVVLALAFTGTTFNMNSFLGTIVLVGIVVNNAIVLVDYVNLLRREQGLPLVEALLEGGRRRLRPILMTTLTTALGLLPLAVGLGEGSEIQAPLARVVVGGLLTSTLITLFFVPSLYLLLERHRLGRAAARPVPVPAERAGAAAGSRH